MAEPAIGLVVHSSEGVTYRFDPGALGLELLPTGGPGGNARREALREPADLARWAAACRLRPDRDGLAVSPEDVATARYLRDALWRIAVARVHGEPFPAPDLVVLNEAAAWRPPALRLTVDGGRSWRTPVTGTQVLAAVARDAVELFSGPYGGRVRECSAHDCRLVFVDTSRPGRRRWCAMEHCGNRHKVRAHRSRREAHEA
ncbi:CGNR zinc finger domain-containing protein [Actinacidiphila sp. bgisy167]|uniref:CGNR zinc finger domain-containing protein n=1 Tax=Actinacidiphila sp. bgisy167 TaxID=3413797 RepID=UPI003D70D87A